MCRRIRPTPQRRDPCPGSAAGGRCRRTMRALCRRRQALVPHIRSAIERRQGRLLHHDGGSGAGAEDAGNSGYPGGHGVLPARLRQPLRLSAGETALPAAGQAVHGAADAAAPVRSSGRCGPMRPAYRTECRIGERCWAEAQPPVVAWQPPLRRPSGGHRRCHGWHWNTGRCGGLSERDPRPAAFPFPEARCAARHPARSRLPNAGRCRHSR